jgi:hypothetical protein
MLQVVDLDLVTRQESRRVLNASYWHVLAAACNIESLKMTQLSTVKTPYLV